MPSCRPTLALSAAMGALTFAVPALAQTYEYAQPATDAAVVFRSEPVVQPLAVPLPPTEVVRYEVETIETPLPPPPPLPPTPPLPPPRPYAEPAYAPSPQAYGAPYSPYGYAQPMPAEFDRDAWLDDCHQRIRGVDRKDRAGVIGGLLGAVAGGVIGNRAWDSHRLAGTLLGAGVGGLAGVAVGSAIGAANERHHDDECAVAFDRTMSGGFQPGYSGYAPQYGYSGYGYPAYGYGYGYGYGYTLVPVLVAVPQRQVIRETVTEEWVDEPVRARTITRARTIRQPAARRDKYIPDKYIKGN